MSHEALLNQAIATINGTMTDTGLVLESAAIKTTFSRSYYRYLETHALPLPYEGSFRVWPRTNRDGQLNSVRVISPNPSIDSSTFSGRVIWIGKNRLAIRVSPVRKPIKPFILTLFHDGHLNKDVQVRYGWAMQFICEYSESRFYVKEAISLKHLLCPKEMPSSSKPEISTEAIKELIVA
ncbi:MAG: hypothetical protein AAGD25_15285 [Cyanobacteria bacterium P01_F01_bin.150]